MDYGSLLSVVEETICEAVELALEVEEGESLEISPLLERAKPFIRLRNCDRSLGWVLGRILKLGLRSENSCDGFPTRLGSSRKASLLVLYVGLEFRVLWERRGSSRRDRLKITLRGCCQRI